ncbi:transketolase-like protein [Neobacillus bataviensis]|uniref:Transketolase-like protein n=1 Tax=Neobacillus bataviensis TaxID=220685 RepID=A0A561D6E5_9BACI|nr:transketolase-like protein [Neobacillus bataviensis]
MGVGMAMAEAHLSSVYNRENIPLIDHYTYAICGDGDLMEGVSIEAASLAGDLQLGKLILIYDSNNITLDGEAFKYKALLFFTLLIGAEINNQIKQGQILITQKWRRFWWLIM